MPTGAGKFNEINDLGARERGERHFRTNFFYYILLLSFSKKGVAHLSHFLTGEGLRLDLPGFRR